MKTRTLLLLSLACAIAILLAGGLMWWRVTRAPDTGTVALGEPVQVGDMVVTVRSLRLVQGEGDLQGEGSGTSPTSPGASSLPRVDPSVSTLTTGDLTNLEITVRLQGASDDAPADDFGLLVGGADRAVLDSSCPAIAGAPVDCTVTFDGDGLVSGGGFLVYRRGDQQAAWVVP